MHGTNPGGRPRTNTVDKDYDAGFADDDNNTISADRGVYFSADGRCRHDILLNVAVKRRKLKPANLDDHLAGWIPVPEDQVDTTLETDADAADMAELVAGDKRKRYESSVSFWDGCESLLLTPVPGRSNEQMETAEAVFYG
jgi:hypothetical protein